MSAPDPREVLAEAEQAFHRSLDTKTPCIGEEAEAAWADFVDRLAAAGVHLSVDGGPPAEPWTTRDEAGRTWRVEVAEPDALGSHHECGMKHLAVLRPVPAGEAERPCYINGCTNEAVYSDTCAEHLAASSDGPAAPTAEVLDPCPVCGASRFDDPDYGPCAHQRTGQYPGVPVAAPATCDGSGEVENLSPIARGEMPRPCPGCPRCTPCGRCGTVGGGGTIDAPGCWPGFQPCPDCGGTAPTGGERDG